MSEPDAIATVLIVCVAVCLMFSLMDAEMRKLRDDLHRFKVKWKAAVEVVDWLAALSDPRESSDPDGEIDTFALAIRRARDAKFKAQGGVAHD